MQIIGFILVFAVVVYGFSERESTELTAFDLRALIMVLGGSSAAILISSSARNSLRTLLALRELLPFGATLAPQTERIEIERAELTKLWREGKRAQAVEMAQNSGYAAISKMLELIISRASAETTEAAFMEQRHAVLSRWQPPAANWELMAKLGPTFGMVGTVAGMIQLFRNMGEDDMNIGAAMSLALLTTLYGLAFGGGIAGPVGHFLQGLIDERLGVLDRCQQSVAELVSSGGNYERSGG